jgi:hypothetical protein
VYETLVPYVDEADHVGKSGTFELAREREEHIQASIDAAAGDPAQLPAARRAMITAVQEIAHRVNDSDGGRRVRGGTLVQVR